MKSASIPKSNARPTVVIGVLGTVLDRAEGPERWSRWRPSVALCQQEDLLVARFELLYDPKFKDLAQQVKRDIGTISPQTIVNLVPMVFENPWDFAEVFERLYDWARAYAFEAGRSIWSDCFLPSRSSRLHLTERPRVAGYESSLAKLNLFV
jgi:transcriptional regulatory protein RtcR